MPVVNIEWIGSLCAVLMVSCNIQWIATGILAFSIPDILWLSGSHLSTGVGLIASLIALPSALRLKTAHMSPNLDRIYGYTLCYQRLAVSVCGALHLLALMLAVIGLILNSETCKDFKKYMKFYHTRQPSKMLVDNVQYALQCCGARDYKDWFEMDWDGSGIKPKRVPERLLREDTDAYPDLALIRHDAVPYSCCSRSSLTTCIHQNIIQVGTFSISTQGCEGSLQSATRSLLLFEFLIYSVSFSLELAILFLLKRHPGRQKSKAYQYNSQKDDKEVSSRSSKPAKGKLIGR